MLQFQVFFSLSHLQISQRFESHESADSNIETNENSFPLSLNEVRVGRTSVLTRKHWNVQNLFPKKYHVMDSFRNLLFGSRQVEGLMFYKMQKNDFDQRNTSLDRFLVLLMVLIMNLTIGILGPSLLSGS